MTSEEATAYGKVVMDLPQYVSFRKQMQREKFEADKIEWRRKQVESDNRYRNALAAMEREEQRVARHHFIGGCFLVTLFGILPAYIYLIKLWWLS